MYEAKFQTFDDPSGGAQVAQRVAALRAELKRRHLDGFIVPHADRHQSEYLPPSEERLAWLTGFTGSAGSAIVLADRAVLFTDGRYLLQARGQTDPNIFSIEHMVEKPLADWLEANLPAHTKLGYDPWLHTAEGVEKLGKACAAVSAMLMAAEPNPIDAIWKDRPPPPLAPVTLHDMRYAGEETGSKLARIREELRKLRVDCLVISDPPALAWTFNIRGSDVAHVPVALGYGIVGTEGRPALYLDGRRLNNETRHALEQIADMREPAAFIHDLGAHAAGKNRVRLDQATAADALVRIATQSGGIPLRGADPIPGMKAVKNATEIAGARAAHLRDGAALTKFLAWFDREAPGGKLTEIDAVAALETFRRESRLLKDISFATIAGSGPNGAVVHYRVTRKTNRRISPGDLFLIDSGGQYQDGTTDVTRTVIVGEPTAEMRDRFTRVLKGHIAIARTVFPEGTTGAQLDTLARRDLWAAGIDYDHGTGHSVGSYLSVHEGPARISKLGTAPLRRGMILSNEPGYYKTGAYGIRIENLVLVVAAPVVEGAEKKFEAFETLTLAPIDRRLIELKLLSHDEIVWVDRYHGAVRAALTPLLDPPTKAWLDRATASLTGA
jgi:Xaa-Pro aminopeptidase